MSELLVHGAGLSDPTLASLRELAQPADVLRDASRARLRGVERTHAVTDYCDQAGLDWAWTDRPRSSREFRLLAMDMDSTLIVIECIDELAKLAGVGDEVARITTAAMRGEWGFPEALRRRVGLLAGLPAAALAQVYDDRLRLSPGAERLLEFARRAGWTTLLVSGGFTYFTERLKTRLGLHATLANELEIEGGRLTGRILGSIVDGQAKAARLLAACAAAGCSPAESLVLGDGANDLPMMAASGFGVAYRAKPVVRRQAAAAINSGGLDAVLGFLD